MLWIAMAVVLGRMVAGTDRGTRSHIAWCLAVACPPPSSAASDTASRALPIGDCQIDTTPNIPTTPYQRPIGRSILIIQIIDWLSPFVRRLQNIHYGWLIPVAILFVLSFPPLFGNEIVMILVGIVWGLGVGFAITAVGIGLGEVANYL